MATIRVIWAGKFDGREVNINADDFDPAIHTRAGEAGASPAPHLPPPPIVIADVESAETQAETEAAESPIETSPTESRRSRSRR